MLPYWVIGGAIILVIWLVYKYFIKNRKKRISDKLLVTEDGDKLSDEERKLMKEYFKEMGDIHS